MISRLTAIAAAFALIGTSALAYAFSAETQPQPQVPSIGAPATASAKAVRIIELPRVVVTARRFEGSPR